MRGANGRAPPRWVLTTEYCSTHSRYTEGASPRFRLAATPGTSRYQAAPLSSVLPSLVDNKPPLPEASSGRRDSNPESPYDCTALYADKSLARIAEVETPRLG